MDRLIEGYKPTVQDGVLYSSSLQREKPFRVLSPDERMACGRLPVLYLLHGYECDYTTWDCVTHLQLYVRGLPLLVVMPDGENSWYTNSATIAKNRFEDYLIKDVIPEIDRRYNTVADRSCRAIAGMSIGGYAAIRMGLKYPELFSFAGSLGGALAPDTHWHSGRAEVFGSPERVRRDGNCLFSTLHSSQRSFMPMFYLGCGEKDWWLDANRAFAQELASLSLAHEFYETPGGHTWDYWDHSLEPMLHAVTRTIAPASTAKGGSVFRALSRLREVLLGRAENQQEAGVTQGK